MLSGTTNFQQIFSNGDAKYKIWVETLPDGLWWSFRVSSLGLGSPVPNVFDLTKPKAASSVVLTIK
jgi:hypothetical protein